MWLPEGRALVRCSPCHSPGAQQTCVLLYFQQHAQLGLAVNKTHSYSFDF